MKVMEPAVQDGPFLIGNRSSNGGYSIAVITPQNTMFLKNNHIHTQAVDAQSNMVFFHPSETVTFWGGLSWCPKETPILVGWTAEVMRKTDVLQESWIHPKKLT